MLNISRQITGCVGGEGALFEVDGNPNLVYKKYHDNIKINPAMQQRILKKLDYMADMGLKTNMDDCFAWPIEVAFDNNALDGFSMRKLKFNIKLNDIYETLKYQYRFHIVVARNLCTLVNQLHRNNVVIGDFNHGNVGVYDGTSIVSMMDCDSFHLASGSHYCGVCMEGYAAPELLRTLRQLNTLDFTRAAESGIQTFTVQTDFFALAVHIFRLLMRGIPPHNGTNKNVMKSVSAVAAGNQPIEEDNYVFRAGFVPFAPECPPEFVLPDEIVNLFRQAFLEYSQQGRPDPLTWIAALERYETEIKQCTNNSLHQYYNRLSNCPWCEMDERSRLFHRNGVQRNNLPAFRVKRI